MRDRVLSLEQLLIFCLVCVRPRETRPCAGMPMDPELGCVAHLTGVKRSGRDPGDEVRISISGGSGLRGSTPGQR